MGWKLLSSSEGVRAAEKWLCLSHISERGASSIATRTSQGLSFLTQSKKNSFFMAPQISSLWIVRRVSPMITVYYRISNQPCGRRRINSLKFGDQPSSGTCGGHWHHLEVRDAHLYQNVRFFKKFIKGGGVISVYKKLCCRFCSVQEAFLQQKRA